MNHRISALAAVIAFVASVSSALACTKDTDCKGDRICVEAVCTAPSNAGASATAAPSPAPIPQTTPSGPAESRTAFHANILGLLQFGLTPTIEIGGDQTILLRARLLNTGLLPYVLAAEEDEDFDFGLGLGVQVRTYTGALSQQGPYLGGGIEVMFTTTSYDAEEYSTTSLVPQVEAGFRWDYPTYIVGVGAFMGATVPISSTGYDIDEEGESIVAAGLMVDIGWYL